MNDLLKRDNPLVNVSAFDEGRLCSANGPVHYWGKPDRVSLSYKFKDDIDQRDRAELTDVLRPVNLGNKREHPKVKTRYIYSTQSKAVKNGQDIGLDQSPKSLAENDRQPIWAWRRVNLHALEHLI
jgi:hypothetical protein